MGRGMGKGIARTNLGGLGFQRVALIFGVFLGFYDRNRFMWGEV